MAEFSETEKFEAMTFELIQEHELFIGHKLKMQSTCFNIALDGIKKGFKAGQENHHHIACQKCLDNFRQARKETLEEVKKWAINERNDAIQIQGDRLRQGYASACHNFIEKIEALKGRGDKN